MRIIYLLSLFKDGDGVSDALINYINEQGGNDHLIVAKWNYSKKSGLNVVEYGSDEYGQIDFNNYDIIHYFKGTSSNVLRQFLFSLKKKGVKLPVVTSICQRPSYKSLLMSPYEIKKSDCFVMIDKASYNDPILNFVPERKKSQIYFCNSDDINNTQDIEYIQRADGKIIFGRGTTLSKCPRDMFDIFDAINVKNKEFHIAGVPNDDNWVAKEAEKRDNVVLHGMLPFNQWFEVCKSFDVLLYYIPNDSHASIDANLGLAMNMRKPVVYMGCDAPKERFEHGENGFIANDATEFVEYAEKLAADFEYRKKIGERARQTVGVNFSPERMVELYKKAYATAKREFHQKDSVKIPLGYYVKYLKRCTKRILQETFDYYPNVKQAQQI
jgi:glycosyltransferase involved in cell wall biosynthesis